jgi:phytoene desaturase
MENLKKAIIIGSGFGGLVLAVRLQSRGIDVTVLEKNKYLGGHAYPLKKDGYTFDMGPSLITAPEIIQRIFNCAGRDMNDYLDTVKLNPFYRIYFHDRTYIDYTDDSEYMKEQMARFNARDAANYDRFMNASKKIHDEVIVKGLGSTHFMNLSTMAGFVPKAIALKALLPTYYFARRYFEDPRHRFTFSFHPLFIGGNPFRAPSVYQMIPYLEKSGGVWFSKGGMYSLVRAFEKLFSDIGGRVETNAEVVEIVIRDGKATGVIANGEYREADLVVSNADFIHTYKDLIKPGFRRKWTDKRLLNLKYSMSAFLIYLGVEKKYPQLLHHTLILSKRYKGLIKDIFDNKIIPDDFSMYLHVPTRTDPSMAPEGKESMYVLIPVANLQSGVDWADNWRAFSDKILNFLQNDFGLDGLRDHIEVMEVFTPEDFRTKQNAYWGSAWGVEPRLTQTAFLRPHNRSEDVANLYIVGASTHPGAGLPGVMLTAETTENVIVSDFGIAK